MIITLVNQSPINYKYSPIISGVIIFCIYAIFALPIIKAIFNQMKKNEIYFSQDILNKVN